MASSNLMTVLAVLSLASFMALAYSSAWLRGTAWFAATIVAMGAFIATVCGAALVGESGIRLWTGALGALVIFGFFFYWIASRHITRTRLLDLGYHSHDAVVRYIAEKQLRTPLARTLHTLGPVLLVAVALLTVLAIGIQFNLTGDL
jgi:hypothetical protein